MKLKDVPLTGKQVDTLDKVRIKKKVYQQVKRVIEWGTLVLEGLRNMLIHHHVERMREQSELTDSEWEEILSFAI